MHRSELKEWRDVRDVNKPLSSDAVQPRVLHYTMLMLILLPDCSNESQEMEIKSRSALLMGEDQT